MSYYAFLGAIEQGLVYGIMALGVFITFRILDFPDLSVDGTFPLGASVAAVCIVHNLNPYIATVLAFLSGVFAGIITGILNTRLKIMNLLSGILVMIALYSVNIRIMGQPNTALLGFDTVFTPFESFFRGGEIFDHADTFSFHCIFFYNWHYVVFSYGSWA